MMVHNIVGRELDWLRRRFVFLPPNLLGGPNLVTTSLPDHLSVMPLTDVWMLFSCVRELFPPRVSSCARRLNPKDTNGDGTNGDDTSCCNVQYLCKLSCLS